LRFSLAGIPVRVHPLFWLVGVLLGIRAPDVPSMLLWLSALFLSILVHELGHALMGLAYGLQPWIVLYGFGGWTSYSTGYGGGAREGRWTRIWLSAAGPLAGFALAGAIVAGLCFSGHQVQTAGSGLFAVVPMPAAIVVSLPFTVLLCYILEICVMWGVLNLMPIYPLDGGQIARELLAIVNPADGVRQSLWLSAITAVGLAVVGWAAWHDPYISLFFAFLAFESYTALKGQSRW
jgi:Zn-dependent protease